MTLYSMLKATPFLDPHNLLSQISFHQPSYRVRQTVAPSIKTYISGFPWDALAHCSRIAMGRLQKVVSTNSSNSTYIKLFQNDNPFNLSWILVAVKMLSFHQTWCIMIGWDILVTKLHFDTTSKAIVSYAFVCWCFLWKQQYANEIFGTNPSAFSQI